jgi:hypothetical protein
MTLGGVTAGVNAISGQIPGFTDLPVEAQRAINSAITAELTGRDPSQALVNSAISAGIGALQNAASAPAGEQEPNLEDILGPSSPPPAPDPAPVYDFAEPAPEPNLEEILSSPAQPPIADDQPEEQEPTESFYEKNAQRFQDEFNKYLASLEAGESPPPEYGVQDMGITEENWNTYNQHMLDMQARGELPTQWRPGEDGTFTYTGDDGDTLTIGADGNIVGVTDAPPGMLPSENPVAPITPATPTAPVKPGTPVKPPAQPPAQPSRSGPDLAALLALLGGSGQPVSGSGQSAPAPVQVAPADVQLMEEIFGTKLFSRDPGGISVADAAAGKRNFSDGGSIDELLKLLRG